MDVLAGRQKRILCRQRLKQSVWNPIMGIGIKKQMSNSLRSLAKQCTMPKGTGTSDEVRKEAETGK